MILVTGSTGLIGSAVVRELVSRGAPVRAFTRDDAQTSLGSGVDFAVGDYDDAASLQAAMEGIERVFILSPIHPDLARRETNIVAAAKATPVAQVVKLSTAGTELVGQDRSVPKLWALHRESEQQIEASGIAFTLLRPNALMQNLFLFADPIAAGVYPVPTGTAGRAWVDVRDVATAAAIALTEDGHEGKAYELTGPETLTDGEIAAKLTVALGHEVTHMSPPIEAAAESMAAQGMPGPVVELVGEVMTAIAAGRCETVADGVMQATGQPPRSFDAFISEFAAAHR